MDVYEATLPWWRAAVRRSLVKTVRWESRVIAKMQEKIRTPWLDAYFVYTSSLGTHTFFMTALPACFFFGYEDLGRGLLMVLAMGVYCSSVVKDLFCSPRPFSPPVTRLTMGSHHLEYGFPSTHSTNSVSIALFLFSHVYELAYPSSVTASTFISPTLFTILTILLGIYIFSIVFGRLYTAMHSYTDCAVGVTLGTAIWWVCSSWNGIPVTFSLAGSLSSRLVAAVGVAPSSLPVYTVYLGRGLGLERYLRNWTIGGGWEVPLILVPLCLLLVHHHPQPVDDCPCFEDAIAFSSVIFGSLVGRWVAVNSPYGATIERGVVMPGSGWILDSTTSTWVQIDRLWSDVLVWWSVAAVKMTLGIMVIFTWRLLAKSALHLILPPTFRLFSRAFQLPNRRFYTPATEYKSVPSEFAVTPQGLGVLHPIPSVIDLPSKAGVGINLDEGVANALAMKGRNGTVWDGGVKMRLVGGQLNEKGGNGKSKGGSMQVKFEDEEAKGETVKHYDADVLTKVIVYAGIAILAIEVLPLTFDLLDLGVKSWVDA
ncbi:hypothetical protein P691DRAFT_707521 [Macrolepiota fuliginosa MF-IS2]|uniref:Phosphatidic acid phosphatase type 2/haloperoxidase domain-containing protein n=1 Tax=Macrolepiota fuliginosa MF-IS2 TaxID=1400762 RepID=A0A9P5XCE1_9AGAR|nr:hypothetical protein P691DRAFT_707521 [Macrolepiota fuliginosa MF-IS2]